MADQQDNNPGAAAAASTATAESGKRKLESDIETAKIKAQELAARLVDSSSAESKRARLADSSQPAIAPINPPHSVAQLSYQNPLQVTSKKISIPNGKVGVIIGKGGETIRYLHLQTGVKIQVTRDADADPYSLTRDVELMGNPEQIARAEQLINDVIAETNAGGSASAAILAPNAAQPGAEQVVVKVPNSKVALLIGKGGDTIKAIQSMSGARVQVIPLRLPPGDTSTERNVYINGLQEQIESARELITEVLSGKRIVNPSPATSYVQPTYAMPGTWAQQGQSQYDYSQGTYAVPTSYYSSYSTQLSASDPSNLTTIPQPPQQNPGYTYYDQQGQTGYVAPNPSYTYTQAPPASGHGHDQNYSQVSVSFAQNSSSQTDGYWTTENYYGGQQPSQTSYGQFGYPQTTYGVAEVMQGPPTSTQAVNGQSVYPPYMYPTVANNAVPAPNSVSAAQQLVAPQLQSQPATNASSQLPSNATEKISDTNFIPASGSVSAAE